MKTENYLLPAHWASVLINGDESGFSEDEIDELNRWYDDTKPGNCVDVSGESEFSWSHDADGYVLACVCLTFTFIEA
jgi:hypothetical protein